MFGPLDHVMLRVEDLEASMAFYEAHLGYEEKGRWDADTFTNVFMGPPEQADDAARLELTHNHDGRSYTQGDAWGHIAVRVSEDGLDDAYAELMDGGVEDYRDPASCDDRYAFVRDPDGHEIELVKRDMSGSARWSIDHTMIRVGDGDAAVGYWARKFGYDLVRRWEAGDFALYFMRPPEGSPAAMSVELTVNYGTASYEVGDAWGHIAVQTDDLTGDWDRLVEREAPAYRSPASCDDRYAFTKTHEGHEIELVRP